MKKNIVISLCGILLLVLGFQIGRMTAPKAIEYVSAEEESDEEIDEPDDFEAYMSNRYEGMPIDGNDDFVATDYKGRPVMIDSLGGANTIFVRYSSSGCRPCIDAMLNAVKKYTAHNPDATAVLLIKGAAMRDIYVMGAELGPGYRLLIADHLPIDFNAADTPVAFQVVDGKIKNHFTARYGDEARTDSYVKSIISPK